MSTNQTGAARILPIACIVACCLAAAPPALAQDSQQLATIDLEDLMRIRIENVFGASSRLQPVTEAPSSVTIITAEDIERHHYRTLADILRSVRGMYISDDRNYSYAGVRGFARAGDYNTRILLLVNGHRVNDAVYEQASLGAEFGIDPAMFQRVEIIRGPASALYGSDAFFGVVNVITRTGESLERASVDIESGTLGTQLFRASVGRTLSNGIDFAVGGTLNRTDGERRLYYPAYDAPGSNNGIAEGLDGEQVGDAYGHLRYRNLMITAAYGHRMKYVPTASFGTIFNEQNPRQRTFDRHTLVDAQYDTQAAGAKIQMRASFDRYFTDGFYPYPADSGGGGMMVDHDNGLSTRWGVEGRVTRTLAARQTVSVGGEFFDNVRQNQWDVYDVADGPGFTIDSASRQGALYAEDEIKVRRWLILDGSVRYDTRDNFRRVTPRGAVIVPVTGNASLKYLYGQAFRSPNVYELTFYSEGIPNTDLRPESITTHEVAWEQYFGAFLRTSLSAYHYDATDLISLFAFGVDEAGFQNLVFVNSQRVRARGFEAEAEVRAAHGFEVLGSYALQRAVDAETLVPLTNSPTHMAKLRTSVNLWRAGSTAALDAQYMSRRTTLSGATVSPVLLLDASVNHAVNRSVSLYATVRNALGTRYADPASAEHMQDTIEQVGRTFTAGIRWSPWVR